ncbi:MAG: PAS domain-containing protein [Bacteroidetes bacterium]|nr:PAS domain-containing protein [Bacteroidota bacterium]MBT7143600.1 PAS domain-containing protein [Bacteroidota bacterium]MBT7490506.1 PAS domain-containing protein [Bacteroidota bacterium]
MEKYKFTHTIVSHRFTRLFASMLIVIGLIVLMGWFSRLMFLTRFSINEVPMAPSTAYVFICLAVGIWFYVRPQKIAINRYAVIVSAVLVVCLSCLLLISNKLEYFANLEHAFIEIPETHLSMQLGHMSLVTLLLFIISGLAVLFLQSNRKIFKTISIILTLIIFIISFILLLGYGFGAPFFYFDSFIPPAVLTVLSFLLVSLALISASDKNTFFVKKIWKTSASAKLFRIFLPTTIIIVVIESLIVIRLLPLLNIHPAIGVSLVSLIVVALVIVVISILSKSMGKSFDTALKNLRLSKERFELAMLASKDGLYDWNLETNEIYYSPGWKSMLGYKDEELPNDFSIWENLTEPEDVKKSWEMQQELINKQRDHFEMELKMKHKDGHWVVILSRAEAFFNDKAKAIRIVGTHVDISDRKHEEKIIAIELNLFEYAINHSEEELLQKFLDEAEKLTGSKVGFFHYIEDDQQSLSLQTWSTNTLNNMCKGLGEAARHYPISEAGVWIDCFKERKPVIHNDYQSLVHKKGLPEGHAPNYT